MQEKLTTHHLSPNEAVTRIMGIKQTVLQTGAVDSELDAFRDILTELSAGRISPEDAVARAMDIAEKRQNYH